MEAQVGGTTRSFGSFVRVPKLPAVFQESISGVGEVDESRDCHEEESVGRRIGPHEPGWQATSEDGEDNGPMRACA
jgi:hypothetical protein